MVVTKAQSALYKDTHVHTTHRHREVEILIVSLLCHHSPLQSPELCPGEFTVCHVEDGCKCLSFTGPSDHASPSAQVLNIVPGLKLLYEKEIKKMIGKSADDVFLEKRRDSGKIARSLVNEKKAKEKEQESNNHVKYKKYIT